MRRRNDCRVIENTKNNDSSMIQRRGKNCLPEKCVCNALRYPKREFLVRVCCIGGNISANFLFFGIFMIRRHVSYVFIFFLFFCTVDAHTAY